MDVYRFKIEVYLILVLRKLIVTLNNILKLIVPIIISNGYKMVQIFFLLINSTRYFRRS